MTGTEPAAELLLENVSAHDRRREGAVERPLAADVVAGHALRAAGLLASHGAAAVIAPKERGEGEGGSAMPRPQTLAEEAVADAQVLAAVPGVQVDELWRLPGEQPFGAAD
jgi:hypothetical protein